MSPDRQYDLSGEHPVLDWQAAASAAYVHIPFCVRKCHYCDFVSYPNQSPATREAYQAALLREIGLASAWAGSQCAPGGVRSLRTVFVGGGTPTVQTPAMLNAILEVLDQGFGLDPDGEFTLEANPGTVTADGLASLRRGGYNRISFGLQSGQPALLQRLGRIHSPDDFVNSVQMAALAGFTSINADLMFGLPDQTLEDIMATLQLVLTLPVNHLSFYSLTLEDGTSLKDWCDAHPGHLPNERLERDQYDLIRRTLQKAGFDHYEISNAARLGHRCRHNLTYWTGNAYYGFGVAAHSYLRGVRRSNTPDLQAYLNQFGSAALQPDRASYPASRIEEIINRDEAEKEMLMLGLRLLDGVRYADFADRFGVDLRDRFAEPVSRLIRRGLLQADGSGLRLTEPGLDLANQVFCEFV